MSSLASHLMVRMGRSICCTYLLCQWLLGSKRYKISLNSTLQIISRFYMIQTSMSPKFLSTVTGKYKFYRISAIYYNNSSTAFCPIGQVRWKAEGWVGVAGGGAGLAGPQGGIQLGQTGQHSPSVLTIIKQGSHSLHIYLNRKQLTWYITSLSIHLSYFGEENNFLPPHSPFLFWHLSRFVNTLIFSKLKLQM